MPRATSGIIAGLASHRPLLTVGVLAIGLTTLAVIGLRNAPASGDQELLGTFLINLFIIVGLPTVFAAIAPQRPAPHMTMLAIVAFVVVLLALNNDRHWFDPAFAEMPSNPVLFAALGLTFYFAALAPQIGNTIGLSVLAPFSALLGVAGAGGYLAMDGLIGTESGGAALAIAMALGICLGASVGADHAKFFADGANTRRAAAGAAHEAIAPAMFSILAVAAAYVIQTRSVNFGAANWTVVLGAFVAAVAATTMTLFAVAGGLANAGLSEQTAANENFRRRHFARIWRPVRTAMPASTAFAVAAIAGIFAVIALFETTITTPVSYFFFLVLIWAAAAIIFVSLRTSLLILVLLTLSGLLANLIFDITGLARPSMLETMAALIMAAIALGQLTVSWRDASDNWRNARDITENAMNDGLRRFLVTHGYSAAVFFAAYISGVWRGGASAAAYLICAAAISFVLAPAFMTAMSARYQRY